MVAVVGTTITPYMQFYLQSAVAEKGIDEEELGLEQADAVVGSIWTNVVAVFIVVATATTLYATGTTIGSAADAAAALGPVAGELSTLLFSIGLFGASVLAATIMPLSTAYVICEAFGWESGVGKRFRDAPVFFSLYTFVLFAGAVVVLIPGLDPIGAHRRQPVPAGPAAADRAALHVPAGQRPRAAGSPRQRTAAQRPGGRQHRSRHRARRRAPGVRCRRRRQLTDTEVGAVS